MNNCGFFVAVLVFACLFCSPIYANEDYGEHIIVASGRVDSLVYFSPSRLYSPASTMFYISGKEIYIRGIYPHDIVGMWVVITRKAGDRYTYYLHITTKR